MAGTYVQISREEIEAWLDGLKWRWSRVAGKAGIYLIHLSDNVAVKLSSTIGTRDDAMGKGRASMGLSLVSRVTDNLLNRRAKDRKHFKRTTNWRKTWVDGIAHWEGVYTKAKTFYDTIASIVDRDKYKADLISKIESRSDWASDSILADFHDKLSRDGVLMPKQVALLERLAKGGGTSAPAAPVEDDLTEQRLEDLRAIFRAARRQGDQWTMDFAQSVADQIKRGRDPSPKQRDIIRDKMQRYRLASSARVAARFLARVGS